jgi:hypothetical protein
MIYLGYSPTEKQQIVADYCAANTISQTIVIAPDRFPLPIAGADQVRYADVIMYVTFYRLLQSIERDTLIVLHECLRTQNRYDLAYNCIRNYLNHTSHVLVFQTLPQIDEPEDFMVLFDWVTQSRWKRRHFDADLIRTEAQVHVREWPVALTRIAVPTSEATRRKYDQERAKLFDGLGAKDPHTLPRNLYLLGGKDKAAYIAAVPDRQISMFGAGKLIGASTIPGRYVARNKRLGLDCVTTYDDVGPAGGPYTVVEFPHRFIAWCDFVSCTGQSAADVLVADLKVDQWYFERYQKWQERICDTYASLRP